MNCEEAQTRWHARLDTGEADPSLDDHLAECDACRVYVADMSDVVGLVVELGRETEFVASVADSSEISVPARPRHWLASRRWKAVLGTAAALVATVTVMLQFDHRTTESPHITPPARHAELGITLRGKSANDFLAVAVPKVQENVQMFWLYPAMPRTAQHDPS